MFELTINEEVYQFRFGLGFVREINKQKQRAVEGMDEKQDVGLQFAVASIIDGDPIALVEILDIANKTEKPRVTRNMLDSYVEDENTNIDELFEKVLDFFKKGNCTKKATATVLEMIEEQKRNAANG